VTEGQGRRRAGRTGVVDDRADRRRRFGSGDPGCGEGDPADHRGGEAGRHDQVPRSAGAAVERNPDGPQRAGLGLIRATAPMTVVCRDHGVRSRQVGIGGQRPGLLAGDLLLTVLSGFRLGDIGPARDRPVNDEQGRPRAVQLSQGPGAAAARPDRYPAVGSG